MKKQKTKLDNTDKVWIVCGIVFTFILIIAKLQLKTIGGC